jgi:hypothetical protein
MLGNWADGVPQGSSPASSPCFRSSRGPIRPASSTFHIDGENEEKLSTWVVKWRGGRVKRCVAKFFTGIWVKDHF